MTANQQPLISHLLELRRRLLRALGAVGLLFLALLYFANDIYHLLALPLLQSLPQGSQMIATDVTTPFIIPMKLTLYVSLFLAIPYVLYQIWAFVAPGLYQHERKLVLPLVIASTALYYLGILFAYFVVFPMLFSFFTRNFASCTRNLIRPSVFDGLTTVSRIAQMSPMGFICTEPTYIPLRPKS